MVKSFFKLMFSRRTRASLRLDRLRLIARIKTRWRGKKSPPSSRLHLGCGARIVPGWFNVDLACSQFDVDLAAPLPWPNESFEYIVSQQVIEHLDIDSELLPLLTELARVSRPGAEIWLSCPDLGKVCHAYVDNQCEQLIADRRTRVAVPWRQGLPSSQMVNVMFHQGNEHKNLYDFPLLCWLLEQSGFGQVVRADEAALLARFPGFPDRRDDAYSLYVCARRIHPEPGRSA